MIKSQYRHTPTQTQPYGAQERVKGAAINHNKHLNPLVPTGHVLLIGDRLRKLVACTSFRELMTRRPVDGPVTNLDAISM
ncbi:unnamed protein product [Colias eurytheme]|nr:unnamed protein product [Colias eurytheme]